MNRYDTITKELDDIDFEVILCELHDDCEECPLWHLRKESTCGGKWEQFFREECGMKMREKKETISGMTDLLCASFSDCKYCLFGKECASSLPKVGTEKYLLEEWVDEPLGMSIDDLVKRQQAKKKRLGNDGKRKTRKI